MDNKKDKTTFQNEQRIFSKNKIAYESLLEERKPYEEFKHSLKENWHTLSSI